MDTYYEIDSLDRRILHKLQTDARTPFLEIARELGVSGGTIHQRVDKLKDMGIITGSKFVLDEAKLGYEVTALVGIHLNSARQCNAVVEKIAKFDEVIEANYTTGTYALMVKVKTKSMRAYYDFLITRLQALSEIRSTESFMCIDTPIKRDISPVES